MPSIFHISRRVEFAHTDAAGIMHFSRFFTMMEEAEHELLRSLGLSVIAVDEQGPLGWPRVRATCDFRGAVRFEDVVDIHVRIANIGDKSVTYAFSFTHADRPIAEGEVTAVCCRLADGAPPRSISIPASFRERLHAAAVVDL